VSKGNGYSKKVQMAMTSPENPMINFEKPESNAATTASLRQRGLLSQIAYLPTSAAPANKVSKKNSKTCKTVSSINSLPGAFIIGGQEEEVNKKLYVEHKNRTTFDLPEEPIRKSKTYNASKLDHQHDVMQNVIYEDEPVGKRSTYATSNKLEQKFDIFGNQTANEPEARNAKSYRSNKLEHHYDIFKQFDPVSN
jgi:hypothetical protein